jgi:hypothetical protein
VTSTHVRKGCIGIQNQLAPIFSPSLVFLSLPRTILPNQRLFLLFFFITAGHPFFFFTLSLPQPLLLVDYVLYQNVCPLRHKSQRRDQFLQALYAFHKGHWYSIPSIIWNQLHKFWDGVIARKASPTKSWGLPFPFLLTHILKKKGIKGTPEDGPVTEHPFFGRN